jgi:hypothetical protein
MAGVKVRRFEEMLEITLRSSPAGNDF